MGESGTACSSPVPNPLRALLLFSAGSDGDPHLGRGKTKWSRRAADAPMAQWGASFAGPSCQKVQKS